MRKAFFLLLAGIFLRASVSFNSYGCKVIKPGQSITLQRNVSCLVIENSRDTIYWVKMTALPFHTGDPELDAGFNSQPRAINYVGCDTYEEFIKEEGCKFCKEDFSYTEFKVGQTLWYLVVGNSHTDFCYITGGSPMRVETTVVERQNDAGSGRDSDKKHPVFVQADKEYSGTSASDWDWYGVKLPREKLIKFSITYSSGPEGKRTLLYGLGSGGPTVNYFTYCTSAHRMVSSQFRDGSKAWYSAFFPHVGETAYCYLKFPKKKPEDPDYIILPFFIKPPPQYPPPDEEAKPKDQYKLPTYTFSFEVVEKKK